MVPLMLPVSVSMIGVSAALTVTVSAAAPTSNLMVSEFACSAMIETLSSTFFLNPSRVMVMEYLLGASSLNVNSPESPLVAVMVRLVSVSTRVMVAPGTTAPVVSSTVPCRLARY